MAVPSTLLCRRCDEPVGEIYYDCKTCDSGFQSCEDCHFASLEDLKPHSHPLKRINLRSSGMND